MTLDGLTADTRRLIAEWEERPQDTRWEAEATIVLERWLAQADQVDKTRLQEALDTLIQIGAGDSGSAARLREALATGGPEA